MVLQYENKKIVLIECKSFWKRFVGIMFKNRKIENAYLFRRCNSIHTFFCFQSIDVICLNKDNKIIGLKNNVKPNRILYFRNGCAIIEIPVNYFKNLEVGNYVKMRS